MIKKNVVTFNTEKIQSGKTVGAMEEYISSTVTMHPPCNREDNQYDQTGYNFTHAKATTLFKILH